MARIEQAFAQADLPLDSYSTRISGWRMRYSKRANRMRQHDDTQYNSQDGIHNRTSSGILGSLLIAVNYTRLGKRMLGMHLFHFGVEA